MRPPGFAGAFDGAPQSRDENGRRVLVGLDIGGTREFETLDSLSPCGWRPRCLDFRRGADDKSREKALADATLYQARRGVENLDDRERDRKPCGRRLEHRCRVRVHPLTTAWER